jgi:hypothetical protein
MKLSPEQIVEKMQSKKEMSIPDIVKKDIATNGKRLGVTLEQGAGAIEQFKKEGAEFKRVGNTLFVIVDDANGIVEYHTINGDPLKAFLYNCLAFFAYLHEQGNTQAKTYFSDEFTKKLLQKYKLKNETIEASDDPEQGTMMLVTNLTRSA